MNYKINVKLDILDSDRKSYSHKNSFKVPVQKQNIYFSIDITYKITAAQKTLFLHKNRLFKKIHLVVYEKYGVK